MSQEFVTQWREAAERPVGFYRMARQMLRRLYLDYASTARIATDNNSLHCLCCHYVFDDQLEEFERLIREFQRLGTFVSTSECIAMARGLMPIEGRNFHLSFDDGFKNVVTNGFPILQRLRVPAAFFVVTSMMDAGYAEIAAFCQRERYAGAIQMATWDDLADVDAELFCIGSHTSTHPRLTSISADEARLRHELVDSRFEIESRIGRACTVFAWPGGQRHEIDQTSKTMAQEAGYEAIFSAFGGMVEPATERFLIPRQHFEVQWPLPHVVHLGCRKTSR